MQTQTADISFSKLTGTVQSILPLEGLYLATIRGNESECRIATKKVKDIDRLRKAMCKGSPVTLKLMPFDEADRPAGTTFVVDSYLHSVQE